jgi:hypothetical protein
MEFEIDVVKYRVVPRSKSTTTWRRCSGLKVSVPWPTQGPASYFASIEKKYGRSLSERQQIIERSGLVQHMEIAGHFKSECAMGHGHANALVGWTLAGDKAKP